MKEKYKKEILMYLGIIYLVIFAALLICKVTNMDYKSFVPYTMLLPIFSAIITTLLFREKFDYVYKNLKINKWIIIGIGIVTLTYGFVSGFEIVLYKFVLGQPNLIKLPSWSNLIKNIFMGTILGGIAAAFEEVGWRGFLQSRVKKGDFLKGYFFIGICWSIFHFPQIISGLLYRGYLIEGIIIHTFMLTMFGVLLCYIKEKSSSIITTSIMHGLYNAFIFTNITGAIIGINQLVESAIWAVLFFTITLIIMLNINSLRSDEFNG